MDNKIRKMLVKIIYDAEDLEMSSRRLIEDFEQEDAEKILNGMIKIKEDISKQISKLKKEM